MNSYRNGVRGGNERRMGPKELSRNRTSALRRVEEDIDMPDTTHSSPRNRININKNKLRSITRTTRTNRKGNNGGSLMSRIGIPVRGKNELGSSLQWCKVTVPFVKQGAKEKILEALEAALEAQLFPVLARVLGNALVFFLEDKDQGEALRHLSKRATLSTGQKLTIYVIPTQPPFHPLQPQEIELIKEAMSRRFNPDTAHLDLSEFSKDPLLSEKGESLFVQRNNVVMAVGKVVQENCPHIRSLDLSANRLRSLDFLGALSFQARNLTILNLSNNQIDGLLELGKLTAWKRGLQDLDLDNNPVCTKFKGPEKYKSALQRLFPALSKLDGTNLRPKPAPLKFGIEEPGVSIVLKTRELPLFKRSFFPSPEVQRLIETFLLEFLSLYDAESDWVTSRQQLQPAYDADATFTLVVKARDPHWRYSDFELYRHYEQDSHNILVQSKWRNFRARVVDRGAINIISHFTRLPRTQHIHQSIFIDVSLVTNAMMGFTIQGLFRDGPHAHTESKEIRFFSRSFLVVPRGQGMSVINDMLLVSPVSPARVSESMGLMTVAAPVPFMSRELMTARLVEASGMKKEWASKCLEDNDWNFELAARAFENIRGSVPADAFQ